MRHLNNRKLLAINFETTGTDFYKDELLAIACFPVNANLQLDNTKAPAILYLTPELPYNDWGSPHKQRYRKYMTYGVDRYQAAQIFEDYLESSKHYFAQKYGIITYNWALLRHHLIKWLTQGALEDYIDELNCRDVMQFALASNDYRWYKKLEYLYDKVDKTFLARKCGTPRDKTSEKDIAVDALRMLEIYNHIVRKGFKDA